MLYPGSPGESDTVGGALASMNRDEEVTVVVPDGSSEGARALVQELLPASLGHGARLPLVRLDEAAVRASDSALLNALHAGAGKGRLSTLEAVAMFLREAGDERSADALLGGLDELVARVARSGQPAGGPLSPRLDGWARALQVAAKRASASEGSSFAPGLRACKICGAVLSSPLQMPRHLEGRRHAEALARLVDGAGEAGSDPDEDRASDAFERFSSATLRAARAEPPDVALAALHAALGERAA